MKWGIWVSVAMVVGALVLVGFQQAEITRLRERIAELEAEPAPVLAPPAGSARQVPGKSVSTRAPRSNAKSALRPDRADGTPETNDDSELGKSLRKMVDNPAGQALMNQGVKAMTAMWFADLIEEFDLTRKESDYFLQLVAGPMSAQQQIGMKMMSAETPEERKKLEEEIKAAKIDAKEAIKDFLNDEEDFARFEEFEKRLPERQQLDGLRAAMASAEAPLTAEQEDLVIEAMYQARTADEGATDWQGTEGLEALTSGNAVEKFEQEWERSSVRTAEAVGKILEGPQLEAFKEYQVQMKDMQLMGLKMAAKMFKKDEGDSGE